MGHDRASSCLVSQEFRTLQSIHQHFRRDSHGKVTDPQNRRSIEFAALVKGKQLSQTLPAEDPLIPAADWKVAGQSTPKVDGRDFVTGRHRYPYDQTLPNMLYGKVLRPPAFDATLKSTDTKTAEKMGVTVVQDGNFIGVAASTTQVAEAAIAGIRAEWKSEPQISNKQLFDYLRKDATQGKDPSGDGDHYETGSVDQAMRPVFSAAGTVAFRLLK